MLTRFHDRSVRDLGRNRRWRGIAAVLLELVAVGSCARIQSEFEGPTLTAELDRAIRETESVRGARLAPVETRVVDSTEMSSFITAQLLGARGARTLGDEVRALAHLGLVPDGFDPIGGLAPALAASVVGLFDPATHHLLLVKGRIPTEEGARRRVLAHELVHAWQDQRWSLTHQILAVDVDDDRQRALRALIEGEAAVVGRMVEGRLRGDEDLAPESIARELEELTGHLGGGLEEQPLIAREELAFPYRDGARFVLAALESGGWEKVDEAWRSPPQSSEQVLHPRRYFVSLDRPRAVAALVIPSAGTRMLDDTVLGELGVRAWLATFEASEVAARAAEGWGGDRLQVWEDRDQGVRFAWRSSWDGESDAVEAFAALVELFAIRFPIAERGLGVDRAWTRTGDRVTWIERRGDRLIVTDAACAACSDRLIDGLWAAPW